MTYPNWMHAALDGELTSDEVQARLNIEPQWRTAWDQLRAVEKFLETPPQAAPRFGFIQRFKANLVAEQRAQQLKHQHSVWGAVVLGFGAFSVSSATALVILPLGALAVWWLSRSGGVTMPTALAFDPQTTFAYWVTIFNSLWISLRAASTYLNGPLVCAAVVGATLLVGLWVVALRKFTPKLVNA